MPIGVRIEVHDEQVGAFLQRFHGGLTDRTGLHSEIPGRAADELEGVKR